MHCLFRFCAGAAAALLLSGCLSRNPVSLLDEPAFDRLASGIASHLRQRGILDSNGSYAAAPLFFSPAAPDGQTLYEKLYPGFFFLRDPKDGNAGIPPSFAALKQHGDIIEILPNGFNMRRGAEALAVRLVGAARWNDDATPDWFLLCTRIWEGNQREWYLVLTSINATPLVPEVIGIRTGVYTPPSPSVRKRMSWLPSVEDDNIIELSPSSRTVVNPPRQDTETFPRAKALAR